MKILSRILIIYILSLAFAPTINAAFASKNDKGNCCSSHEKKTEQPVKSCCNNMDIPFMGCCNYSALNVSSSVLVSPFTYSVIAFNVLKQTMLPGFTADAWHPPQIA